jgi:hypothetical protein
MSQQDRFSRLRQSLANLRVDWVEIGGLGRLAVAGVVLALTVTLILGASITRSARGHLLDARSAMVAPISVHSHRFLQRLTPHYAAGFCKGTQ